MNDISIATVERLDLRFRPRQWPFAEKRRDEIDAHFAMLQRQKPALWNGRVMLLYEVEHTDNTIRGTCLETDYASMLAWRDWDFPDRSVRNFFGSAALRAADGAFVLGVMAPHTANGGQIYFPTGTPDPSDVFGDGVDLDHSVLRELREETGLTGESVTIVPGWHAVFAGQRIALMKSLRLKETAEAVRERILAHMATEAAPELAGVYIARGPSDLDGRMPPFVAAFLRHQWAPAAIRTR
jgi:8-oxo-dGTP pyrophosphatase MutT (NUDIX family)